jgi:phosphoribosylcarboxyaminoimidazole (NCAIR) mutase
MNPRCYIGIAETNCNDWAVALCTPHNTVQFGVFKNTAQDMAALLGFIRQNGDKPKICVPMTCRHLSALMSIVISIPGVEWVMMSSEGIRHHSNALEHKNAVQTDQNEMKQAYQLARCAERII